MKSILYRSMCEGGKVVNLVNRTFQLQCVFRENKYMKKLLYTIVLLIAVLIIPAQPAHARAIGIPRIPLSGNVVTIPKGRVTSKVVKYFKNTRSKYIHTVNYRDSGRNTGLWE